MLIPIALTAFAANSLLCRHALRDTSIDAATFTLVRIVSGAAALLALARVRRAPGNAAKGLGGSWPAAAALFGYAILFSLAYRELSAGSGALLLFGAVQVTMILWGWMRGERPRALQLLGVGIALFGLAWLVLPRVDASPRFADAPPPLAAAAMLLAGAAWGAYTLLGRGAPDPLGATAGNFARALPLSIAGSIVTWVAVDGARADARGVMLAAISGALTSGVGYAIWYSALRGVGATVAASVQLAVPLLAAFAGVLLLGETWTARSTAAAIAILGGITLVLRSDRPPRRSTPIGENAGASQPAKRL